MSKLILSIFPGVGLLDRAFEEAGYCVVRGPDILWGGDIRAFDPPEGHFWGVIGGPPCQEFSSLRRCDPTGYGVEMLSEFSRCVVAARPEWFLLENVSRVPNVANLGDKYSRLVSHSYTIQRLDINQAWFSNVTRLRHIQFGSLSGRLLHIPRQSSGNAIHRAAVASDERSFDELCRLQGLPEDFDLPGFLASEKKRAVGNGVPLPMGRALVRAVTDAYACGAVTDETRCGCGCGRWVTGRRKYYDYSCRKRAQRKRDTTGSRN